jgi:hypothetical protein
MGVFDGKMGVFDGKIGGFDRDYYEMFFLNFEMGVFTVKM